MILTFLFIGEVFYVASGGLSGIIGVGLHEFAQSIGLSQLWYRYMLYYADSYDETLLCVSVLMSFLWHNKISLYLALQYEHCCAYLLCLRTVYIDCISKLSQICRERKFYSLANWCIFYFSILANNWKHCISWFPPSVDKSIFKFCFINFNMSYMRI